VQGLGWKLDFKKFRIYLQEKYAVKKAYYFIGHLADQKKLYASLKEAGFTLVFKPTLRDASGAVKGNCDAELVLQAMIELPNYKQAVVVTGDGDFHCLVKHLDAQGKLAILLAPSHRNCSSLLRRILQNRIVFLEHAHVALKYKKSPGRPGAMKGNPVQTEP
jgi:uncharacterized LabA/DUF88 family protein